MIVIDIIISIVVVLLIGFVAESLFDKRNRP
jgi:uncharacterized membrane protein YeaQ/YmgE (transglycosylase-associated protein family)